MPSDNVFRFTVFKGYFLEVIYYWLGALSWIAMAFLPIFMFTLFDGPNDQYTRIEVLMVFSCAILYRLFYVVSKRLIFRRLDIELQEDHITINYLKYLFLSEKTINVRFCDIAACKLRVIKPWTGKQIWQDHLKITMKDGSRYRISSDIQWLKAVVEGASFDISSIAEAYEEYQGKHDNILAKPA